jgi:hypothetical protein
MRLEILAEQLGIPRMEATFGCLTLETARASRKKRAPVTENPKNTKFGAPLLERNSSFLLFDVPL